VEIKTVIAIAVVLIAFGMFLSGTMDIEIETEGIFSGLIVGIGMAFLGWAKTTTPEAFDPAKFLHTVVMGGIGGLMLQLWGIDWQQFEAWMANAGLTVWLDYLVKILTRRLQT